jgi:hypothetical protein
MQHEETRCSAAILPMHVRRHGGNAWRERAKRMGEVTGMHIPVGAWPCVGHREKSWLCVLDNKVLVLELLAVYRLAPGAILVGEVTALEHGMG